MPYNLLTEALLSVGLADGTTERMSLPGVLAALERDRIASFRQLQPHQGHPWHAFLCQLAALALEKEALPDPTGLEPHQLLGAHDEEQWRGLLRALTPDHPGDAPWTLVVADLAQPAMLQPPVPEGDWAALDKETNLPDDLDVLVSARSHGLKEGRNRQAQAEHWLFALLSLQTNGNFMGKGNYGIARQNGGYATRPGVGLAPEGGPGGRWARDTRVILDHYPDHFLERLPDFNADRGLRLVWLAPWDGLPQSALAIGDLHPLFIEVCRRVRLRPQGERIVARRAGSGATRIAAKELKGNLADPWIPIRREDASAFNSRPTYQVIQQVLFDRGLYRPSLCQAPSAHEQHRDSLVVFDLLVRGEGKTEGYVERRIPVPAAMVPFLGVRSDQAAQVAKSMVELCSQVEYGVLKPALAQAMQAAKPAPDYKQKETTAWAAEVVHGFDREMDQFFFTQLWPCLEAWASGDPEADFMASWRDFLGRRAWETFQRALEGLPLSGALRYKALARAEGRFAATLRKTLQPEKGGDHA